MTVRYASSFMLVWLAAKLVKEFERDLKNRAFDGALYADISYYDRKRSDDILNAIVTQTRYAGRVVKQVINLFQMSLLALMYLLIALVLAPELTLLAMVLLGGITVVTRGVIESGYTVGDRVAEANEQLQRHINSEHKGFAMSNYSG